MTDSSRSTVLLLGGNEADTLKAFVSAINQIRGRVGEVTCMSAMYRTQAWGKEDQADFFNQALLVHTELSPHHVLITILDIEKELGRVRKIKWDHRLIDIDILLYEDIFINDDTLQIPHPFLADRLFSLLPLRDVLPGWIHPTTGQSIEDMIARTDERLEVRRVD